MTGGSSFRPGWIGGLENLGVDALGRILDRARSEGIAEATTEALRIEPRLVRALSSTGRADWRFHLPTHDHERAVVLGSGLGGTAFDLVEDYGEVVSCETSPEGALWQRLSVAESSLDRVRILQVPMNDVPLDDASTDLVALDRGVNCALADLRSVAMRARLQSILDEAARLLRPGGWIYWGIENRGLFTRPNSLASPGRPIAVRIRRRVIAQQLVGAGFGRPVLYWVRPSCDEQVCAGRLDDPRTLRELERDRSGRGPRVRLRRLAVEIGTRAALYRPFVPHLLVFARRESSGGKAGVPA